MRLFNLAFTFRGRGLSALEPSIPVGHDQTQPSFNNPAALRAARTAA